MTPTTLFVGAIAYIVVLYLGKFIAQKTSKSGIPILEKKLRNLAQRVQGLRYLVNGPQIIDREYAKAQGRSFKVSTPSNEHVMITSVELIKEVMNAPLHTLSLHAMAKEMLQPKHTMHGFEWQDQRGVEGTGFVRALRSRLTAHLPQLHPDLDRIIRCTLNEELSKPERDGFAHTKLFSMIKRIVTKANCLVFFGEELSKNHEFTAAALEFPQIVIIAAEFMRMTPELLRPLVASLVTRRHRAAKILFRHLEPIVSERLANRSELAAHDNSQPVPVDCMQWLIDTSPRKSPWTPARMIGEIMAIWFSSVHQLAMTATYAVEDLCLHDEYIEPLRQEIQEQMRKRPDGLVDVEQLPLLDSFLKESVRFSNADAISCRRKALKDYVLQDGSVVKKDNWICIPQRAMMHDSQRYSNPAAFDGFRFARANTRLREGQATREVPDGAPSNLTTTSVDWPIWGLGNTACPGRFYASLVLKLIVTQLLTEWECAMPDKTSARTLVWRSSVVPREGTVVMFRKRSGPCI